jgi:TonB family protein
MTLRTDLAAIALSVASALLPVGVYAQPAAPPNPGAAVTASDAPTPPRLLAFVDAGYPESARAEQLEASVLLQLTIGDDGFVEEAALLEPPIGHGFDELALAAARRFVFEPASKGGQPMRSRIQYRYEFKFQPPPSAPVEQVEPEARVTVTVRSAENNRVVSGAELILSKPDDPAFALRIESDETGQARAVKLAPGSYELRVSHPQFKTEQHSEALLDGQTTELTYRLERALEYEAYGAVARVKAPPREVTRRTIEREELTRVAGTRGDALRTIELLPGVSRPPFGAGLVLIRGAAPGDSTVLVDGIPVPLLYHFGGLTSFINSRALERIDFYPGNFSVRYGRALGGIVDVGIRDPSPDKYHGMIDTNLPLDTSLLLEGPITENASFMVAGRRSYVGEVITAVLPDDAFGAFAAPVYYDYQGFLTYRPTDKDRLRLGVYGSSDRLDVLFADDADDPGIQGIEIGQQFHRVQLGWRHRYSSELEHDFQLAFGREDNVFSLPPDLDFDLTTHDLYLRGEWRYRLSKAVQLIVGTDSTLGQFSVSYEGPSLPDSEMAGEGRDFESLPSEIFRLKDTTFQIGMYLELALQPIKQLRIVPGLRLDYEDLIKRFSLDPRIAAIWSVTERTRLKAGFGVFSQPPEPPQPLRGFGNPNLIFTQALHYSAGVEQDITSDLSLNVEGFYKSIYNRVVGTDYQQATARGVLDPPPFDNDGIGRIYGLEVQGRKQAKGRWFGFLSYTLMRSERKDHDEPWRPFNFDQTHIFSAAGNVRLGRGWEVGSTIRIVTGNPQTPVAGASFDQDIGTFRAENGRPNSRRSPTFNRIDLRGEKTWVFDSWRLALYLDVQNIYNAKNPEGITYSYNYKQSELVRGLTILPVLGLRGEL